MKEFLGIESIKALQVIDSRGNPTVQVEVVTEGRIFWNCDGSIRCIYR